MHGRDYIVKTGQQPPGHCRKLVVLDSIGTALVNALLDWFVLLCQKKKFDLFLINNGGM